MHNMQLVCISVHKQLQHCSVAGQKVRLCFFAMVMGGDVTMYWCCQLLWTRVVLWELCTLCSGLRCTAGPSRLVKALPKQYEVSVQRIET